MVVRFFLRSLIDKLLHSHSDSPEGDIFKPISSWDGYTYIYVWSLLILTWQMTTHVSWIWQS